jgi:hypothetical protein
MVGALSLLTLAQETNSGTMTNNATRLNTRCIPKPLNDELLQS